MTAHDLHDALSLLPGDLITATDRLRTAPKPKVIHWKRWVSLAACLVLVLSVTMVFGRELLPAMGGSGKCESAPQAPAAMAPAVAGDTVEAPAAEAPAAPQDAPAEDISSVTTDEKGVEEELYIDHSHRFAEETDITVNSHAYCGNMTVTIDVEGERFTISGSDAIAVTDILIWLDYDPDAVCRCMTDIIVDTETLTGIRLNLVQGFARCEKGQAALTEEQTKTLQEIIDKLQ